MAVLLGIAKPAKHTNGAYLNTPQLMPTLTLRRPVQVVSRLVGGRDLNTPQIMPTLILKKPWPSATGGGGGTQGYGS